MTRVRRNLKFWWTQNGLDYITPAHKENPEGWSVALMLKRTWTDHGLGLPVLDFGCGRGRLTHAFAPADYVGWDINPVAMALARSRNPEHFFLDRSPEGGDLGILRTVLFYTVLQHLFDDEVLEILYRLKGAPKLDGIVIVEIMDRRLRRGELANGFVSHNRDLVEYVDLLEKINFKFIDSESYPVDHYAKQGHKATVAVFKKCEEQINAASAPVSPD